MWGRGGMCLMGDLRREVHEWPVFAHLRLSVLGFYIHCIYTTALGGNAAEGRMKVFSFQRDY